MITLNDHPVLKLDLVLPKRGVWVLDVQVDADQAFTGAVTLDDGVGNLFSGVLPRPAQVVTGRVHARITGGKGGQLSALELAAAHYQSATARIVADEIAAAAGETIDPSTDPLTTVLESWSRQAAYAGQAFSLVADAVGVQWRVLPNGNVWLGAESNDELVLPEVLELDRDGVKNVVLYGLDALSLRPGRIFRGQRIARIHYCQTEEQPLRAKVWPEAA